MLFVRFRGIRGIRSDVAGGFGLQHQTEHLRPVVVGDVGPSPDQLVAAIDANVGLVAEPVPRR